jgi:hypothetical protein
MQWIGETGRGDVRMQITKTALSELLDVLKENEGKNLRVVFKGFG